MLTPHLTPVLVRLMQTAEEIGSTCDEKLADKLCIAKTKVQNEWKAIRNYYGVHNRNEALALAIDEGVILRRPPRGGVELNFSIFTSDLI